jgi:hypothetical protein
VATLPQGLTRKHHLELAGSEHDPWTRRILLAVLGLFLALGLLGVFGQRPETSTASGPSATLEVHSPSAVRGGLIFQSRFRIDALAEVRDAILVLQPGWFEAVTLNTAVPGPIGEASRDGSVAFELGRIPAGQKHVLFLDFQVNPTNVGRRSADVDLYDGDRLLARVERTITVWP